MNYCISTVQNSRQNKTIVRILARFEKDGKTSKTLWGTMSFVARALILASLIALMAKAAAQQTSNRSTYYTECKEFSERQLEASKGGYFCSGLVHGLAGVSKLLSPEYRSCVPSSVIAAQLARVVVKFIDQHPEGANLDFRVLALAAFHHEWPCP